MAGWEHAPSFNSLQTGRHIQTGTNMYIAIIRNGFNSLQTGRHIQTTPRYTRRGRRTPVSIPFKREGTFRRGVGISLRRTVRSCFNSLQTGRHIQTYAPYLGNDEVCMLCFNSLQTGRHIQTHKKFYTHRNANIVSIPFKREGTFRRRDTALGNG